jgi:hypothetical protein
LDTTCFPCRTPSCKCRANKDSQFLQVLAVQIKTALGITFKPKKELPRFRSRSKSSRFLRISNCPHLCAPSPSKENFTMVFNASGGLCSYPASRVHCTNFSLRFSIRQSSESLK